MVTDDGKEVMPKLGNTKRDLTISAAKGILGAIPFAGSLLAEIVGQVIPEQRVERLEAYARKLDERLQEFADDFEAEKAKKPENVDLFEEGALQATRALSVERLEYISHLVARGMTGEEKDRIESKRMLSLLKSLDDAQIIILASYLHRNSESDEFRRANAAVLDIPRAHFGSSREEIDRSTVAELARAQLKALGLLHSRFSAPKKGQMPEFDTETGTLKSGYTELTSLGRLLLNRIGLCGPDEF